MSEKINTILTRMMDKKSFAKEEDKNFKWSYDTILKVLILMFGLTVLFCTIDDVFLKFEPIYYQVLKQQQTCSRVCVTSLNVLTF